MATEPDGGRSVQCEFRDRHLLRRVERTISSYLGRPWSAEFIESKSNSGSHIAAVLSDGKDAFFAKIDKEPDGRDRLRSEVRSLEMLEREGGLRVPVRIGLVEAADTSLLLLEAVTEVPRGDAQWRRAGRALAELHVTAGEKYGLSQQGYWGDLAQDNRQCETWIRFFVGRRVIPRLSGAMASGNLPHAIADRIKKLVKPMLSMPDRLAVPRLLHGDAHQNNILCTEQGPTFIDPSPYYGDPEVDLAYVDFFAPISKEFYAGYSEVEEIASGFWSRRELWRLPARLAMVEVEGVRNLGMLSRSVANVEAIYAKGW